MRPKTKSLCRKDIVTSKLEKLDIEVLKIVADKTRAAVLNRVSKHGGHVESNLGFVEATVALHYVFNAPADKYQPCNGFAEGYYQSIQ